MKKCTGCKKTKPRDDFYNDRATKDGKQWHCKSCQQEYQHKRKSCPIYKFGAWERQIKRNFGLTASSYFDVLSNQGGGCAVCGKSPKENGKRLAVDHNHQTGEIRGILCDDCNVSIGRMNDDPDQLMGAANYLTGG